MRFLALYTDVAGSVTSLSNGETTLMLPSATSLMLYVVVLMQSSLKYASPLLLLLYYIHTAVLQHTHTHSGSSKSKAGILSRLVAFKFLWPLKWPFYDLFCRLQWPLKQPQKAAKLRKISFFSIVSSGLVVRSCCRRFVFSAGILRPSDRFGPPPAVTPMNPYGKRDDGCD